MRHSESDPCTSEALEMQRHICSQNSIPRPPSFPLHKASEKSRHLKLSVASVLTVKDNSNAISSPAAPVGAKSTESRAVGPAERATAELRTYRRYSLACRYQHRRRSDRCIAMASLSTSDLASTTLHHRSSRLLTYCTYDGPHFVSGPIDGCQVCGRYRYLVLKPHPW